MPKIAWKWIVASGWMLVGAVIVGISLYKINQLQVEPKVVLADAPIVHTSLEDFQITSSLPESEVRPGDWKYPFKAAYDWMWWRVVRDDGEKTRRLLWLANQRMRSGYELVLNGKPLTGVEQMLKAESYLQKSASQAAVQSDMTEAIHESAEQHLLVLERAEELVPEQLRPRVTEMKNVAEGLDNQ